MTGTDDGRRQVQGQVPLELRVSTQFFTKSLWKSL